MFECSEIDLVNKLFSYRCLIMSEFGDSFQLVLN
jgi:hypothetical protein